MKIRIGTRGSKLALAQSHWVSQQLQKQGCSIELIELKTEGDIKTGPLAQIGGQGLFTKRIQQALLNREVDLAVHSLKDLPTTDLDELTIAAVPVREDVSDALISRRRQSLEQLPANAVVGTGSVRRAAQLKYLRPDLQTRDIRGNVETRLNKLQQSKDLDAILLACAGLNRLGLSDNVTMRFDPTQLLPAVGQGALGLEVRRDQPAICEMVHRLNDAASYHAAMAERAMLQTLYAGCLAPVGAHTLTDGDQLSLRGVVLSVDGKTRIEAAETLPLDQSKTLGQRVAESLFDQGARQLLERHP